MSLFRSDRGNGSLVFQDEYKSPFQQKIYEKFILLLSQEIRQNPSNRYNPHFKDCIDLIDEFLSALHFKINQPLHERLREISIERVQTLTKLGSQEVAEKNLIWTRNWLALSKTTKVKGEQFDQYFIEDKNDVNRFGMLEYTSPFSRNWKDQLNKLGLPKLDDGSPLKKFLKRDSKEVYLFILTGEGKGRTSLYAYQAISEVPGIQEDKWAYADINANHWNLLDNYLESKTFQYLIIDVSSELCNNQCQSLKELLVQALHQQKKVVLLNSHLAQKVRAENLQTIKNINPDNFGEEIIPRLQAAQIDSSCQQHQDKYLFVGGKYRQLQNILQDKSCGLSGVMSQPEYLHNIIITCEEKESAIKHHNSLYIEHRATRSVPLYSLENLLKQTTAKIIWIENAPSNISDLLKKWFQNRKKPLSKNKFGLFSVIKNVSTIEKYHLFPTSSQKVIITETFGENLLRKIKRKVLHLFYIQNQLSKESSNLQKHEGKSKSQSQNIYQVEVVKGESLTESIVHSISSTESLRPKNTNLKIIDKLLKPSPKKIGRVNWIIGDAGMGKSYLLCELEKRWQISQKNQFKESTELDDSKKNYSYEWVFKISLTQQDYNILTRYTKFEDFLVSISPEGDKKRLWLREALELDTNNRRVLILFDEWDEVKPDMHEKLKTFFSIMPSTVSCVIATRPYGQNVLDLSKWRNYYYKLKPFDEKQIYEYVKNFFSEKAKNLSEGELKCLADEILLWTRNLGNKFSQIVGTPLQIYQLCELLLKTFPEDSNLNISQWFMKTKPINLADLYEKFIFAGFCKTYFHGQEASDTFYDCFERHYNFLAIQAYQQLFEKSSEFIQVFHEFDTLSKESIKKLNQTGIVKIINIENGKNGVQFIHQTYTEYFAAFYSLRAFARKEQNLKLYQEVLKDINDKKYMDYYKLVLMFAFQISLNGHPLLTPSQSRKDYIVRELWETLCGPPKDLVGKALAKLIYFCRNPLTKEQHEYLFSLLPKDNRSEATSFEVDKSGFEEDEIEEDKKFELQVIRSFLSAKLLNLPRFDKCWLNTRPGESQSLEGRAMLEEFDDEKIMSSLKEGHSVLNYTQYFIEKYPNAKEQLARCFKRILGDDLKGKDLNHSWDKNDGFRAMGFLGDYFDKDHAFYFKFRLTIDQLCTERIQRATSAVIILMKNSSLKETFKEATLILLLIFCILGKNFTHYLETILQSINPVLLIHSLVDIGLFTLPSEFSEFCPLHSPDQKGFFQYMQISFEMQTPLKLIFAIAYVADYAILYDEELVLITGDSYIKLSEGPLDEKSKKFISELLEGYDPLKCTSAHFIEKQWSVELTQDIFQNMSVEKQNERACWFSDGKSTRNLVKWLEKNKLLESYWIRDLEVAVRKNFNSKYWGLNGGFEAIMAIRSYFNAKFCLFIILRAWRQDLKVIKLELAYLGHHLLSSRNENGDNFKNARMYYRYLRNLMNSGNFNEVRKEIRLDKKQFKTKERYERMVQKLDSIIQSQKERDEEEFKKIDIFLDYLNYNREKKSKTLAKTMA